MTSSAEGSETRPLIAAVAASVVFGLLLLALFDPGVQQDSAGDLAANAGEARQFLIADLLFPFIYAGWAGLALLRLGARLGRAWMRAGAGALAVAGVCDLAENVLLLIATGDRSPGLVDAAHAIAVPKLLFFAIGAAAALAALVVGLRKRGPAG